MTADLPDSALELRSTVTSHGTLELSLHDVAVPTPAANEVLVRVEASPINSSDSGVLIPGADMTAATVGGAPSAHRWEQGHWQGCRRASTSRFPWQ